MLPIVRIDKIIEVVLDALSSPKKLAALVIFSLGASMIGWATALAQGPQSSPTRVVILVVAGFLIGSGGAVYYYWLREREKRAKDMDSVAIETLSKHSDIIHNAQKATVTPWKESIQNDPHTDTPPNHNPDN